MIVNCHAFIKCDFPGCTKQFLLTHAWEITPTKLAKEATKTGWQERKHMKMEPRMYCKDHAKYGRGESPTTT